jgi:two-component system, cell cycle sensor histidine kinase and response regulator CckA
MHRSPDEAARELAHDLNNLLTAIIGAAETVLERSGIDSESRADIAHIREGARRGAAMVRRLHGDNSITPQLNSVNETIRATYRLLDHRLGANIALTMHLAEPGALAMTDPSQLDRALLNLIANAGHAMPNGGTVAVSTMRRTVAVAEALIPDTIPPGDYVVISVADTGAGMPSGQMPRIFEAGFTSRRRTDGSGLGLSSTREIVRQANGFLSVTSVEGHGTRFEIYLPRVEGVPPLTEPEPTQSITAAHTVLLVDDEPLVRRLAERTLQRAGWNVLCAASAEDALEVVNNSVCELLISDIAMPGMDGVALARLVLARHPKLPVMLISGYERDARDNEAELANIVFLTKPYESTDLLTAAAKMVRQPPALLPGHGPA